MRDLRGILHNSERKRLASTLNHEPSSREPSHRPHLAQSILSEGESQKMALTQEDLQAIFAPLED